VVIGTCHSRLAAERVRCRHLIHVIRDQGVAKIARSGRRAGHASSAALRFGLTRQREDHWIPVMQVHLAALDQWAMDAARMESSWSGHDHRTVDPRHGRIAVVTGAGAIGTTITRAG
jgi:hypothetical protein